ncbi:MAG: hypothetical protein OHK93_005771 [Ramalina farinacea]|uniref:ERCC4 domain-containing protein n=1 Tax=Ramalina farinacea TaxID=258253 RepID=A0AA43TTV0_9LECA|nr:hypothetical protein [Ramalina farinacea]
MPGEDVIILLSSDDETALEKGAVLPSRKYVPPTSHNDLDFLKNDYENIDQFEDEWLLPQPKRHKSSALSSNNARAPASALIDRKTGTTSTVDRIEADSIIFTSSAHQSLTLSQTIQGPDRRQALSDLSDDSLPEDFLQPKGHPRQSLAKLSESTATLLASLTETAPRLKSSKSRERSHDAFCNRSKPLSHDRRQDADLIEDGVEGKPKQASNATRSKLTEEERQSREQEKEKVKEARARDKELLKEAKAKEKESEKERKRLEREEKAKDKRMEADIAEVNKSKLDKKESTREMIVDLPASMDGTRLADKARLRFQEIGADVALYQSPLRNVVKWRRKVKARWNEELDRWDPLDSMVIEEEKHVLCFMSAEEFSQRAMCAEVDEDLELHHARLRGAVKDCTPIYLIENLHGLMNKRRTAQNRAFQAQVNGQEYNTYNQRKSAQQEGLQLDEDRIEDALLRLQVEHGCLVHHTREVSDSALWIAHFTQHISAIPYRRQKMDLDSTFSMESGQVKTGEDKQDTFFKMLQEVVRITPPVAEGIVQKYPSVMSLTKAFQDEGPLMLQELRKAANKSGASSDSRIGPSISRRLYKVFTDTDPASTDV